MDLPDDADGDVIRRLQRSGFDFSRPCTIDFNVDFEPWPPPDAAIRALSAMYPSAKVYEPDGEAPGYIQFEVYDLLTYRLVIRIQSDVTEAMRPFGGECCSWGVLH